MLYFYQNTGIEAPMARTLDQIVAELDPTFKPQVQSLQERANLIPGQIKAEEQGLVAKQGEAFDSILSGARRRGLGFSGIPLGEQARYTATEYLPAIARLRQTGREQQMSLQDAINSIYERRDTQAQNILQAELNRDESARQAAASRAAAAVPTLSSFGGQAPQASAGPRVVENRPGSFAFFDAGNAPITAAQYAKMTGQNLGDLLFSMAERGDAAARSWYNILQAESRNEDGGAGYRNALAQAIQRAPHIFVGAL